MININIINKLVKGIAEQIPLVHSYYNDSPYESWNVKETKFGSVSFVVTKTTSTEQTTIYDAVLYYGDRLTENKSNRDSIHSDAAIVIQTIVGTINNSNDAYITVDYPVAITLFEQSFCDDLAGGYANLVITVEGFGGCIDDDINIPEIIGGISDILKSEFELFMEGQNAINTNFAVALRNNVTYNQFDDAMDDINKVVTNLAVEVLNSVDKDYFDGWRDGIMNAVNSKVSTQTFLTTFGNTYTKLETDNRIKEVLKSENIESLVTDIVTEQTDDIVKEATDQLRDNIDDVVADEISKQLGVIVTEDYVNSNYLRLDDAREVYLSKTDATSTYYTKSQINDIIDNIDVDLTDYPTKTEVATTYCKISDTYNKNEIDTKLGDIDNILNNILYIK